MFTQYQIRRWLGFQPSTVLRATLLACVVTLTAGPARDASAQFNPPQPVTITFSNLGPTKTGLTLAFAIRHLCPPALNRGGCVVCLEIPAGSHGCDTASLVAAEINALVGCGGNGITAMVDGNRVIITSDRDDLCDGVILEVVPYNKTAGVLDIRGPLHDAHTISFGGGPGGGSIGNPMDPSHSFGAAIGIILSGDGHGVARPWTASATVATLPGMTRSDVVARLADDLRQQGVGAIAMGDRLMLDRIQPGPRIDMVDVPSLFRRSHNDGGISEDYRMGRTEVTNEQYAAFLNAVATDDDANALYDTRMTDDLDGGLLRVGTGAPYLYMPKRHMASAPVNYVSAGDARRFCNWLHNDCPVGSQGDATTEDGAYDMDGAQGRRVGATWVLPTDLEWSKAAYFDPSANKYREHATISDVGPAIAQIADDRTVENRDTSSHAPDGVANYGQAGSKPGIMRTGEGGSDSSSFYGTYDQAGNVAEWTETFAEGGAIVRGGGFTAPNAAGVARSAFDIHALGAHAADIGFRVASRTPHSPVTHDVLIINNDMGITPISSPDPNRICTLEIPCSGQIGILGSLRAGRGYLRGDPTRNVLAEDGLTVQLASTSAATGSNPSQRMTTSAVFDFYVTDDTAEDFDLRLVSRIDRPAGLQQVRLRNRSTGSLTEVYRGPVSSRNTTIEVPNLESDDWVSPGDGHVEVHVEYNLPDAASALSAERRGTGVPGMPSNSSPREFSAFIDQLAINYQ